MASGPGSLQGLVPSPFTTVRFGELRYIAEPLFQHCGRTSVACRKVRGKLVEEGKWPWQVSILFLGMHICSGTLVNRQWVLTAAHCFQRSKNTSEYSVKMGIRRLSENGTQLLLSHIKIHEKFNNFISEDIALLKLQYPITWSSHLKPVCLPDAKFKLSAGTLCWVTGWDQPTSQETPKAPQSLQEVAVKIKSNEFCNRQYQFLLSKSQKFIRKDMLCASSEWGTDSCKGESGSPLLCQVNKTWIQMGVVSWSSSCRQHQYPSIYTSTSYFSQWIKKHISNTDFISRAGPTFLSPVFLIGYILLVSLGSLWLL